MPYIQVNKDCNENIGRVDNELKLLATSKKFPDDNVVKFYGIITTMYCNYNCLIFIEFNSC